MKNKTKIKLLLSLVLLATPTVAQPNDKDTHKREIRARNFADFLLYWADWSAYVDVRQIDKKRAERDEYEEAKSRIPELVRDSTYYANEIVNASPLINERFALDERPDMAYFMYEVKDTYKDKRADKNSAEYKLGHNLSEYEKVLKALKLTRYTMEIHQK